MLHRCTAINLQWFEVVIIKENRTGQDRTEQDRAVHGHDQDKTGQVRPEKGRKTKDSKVQEKTRQDSRIQAKTRQDWTRQDNT